MNLNQRVKAFKAVQRKTILTQLKVSYHHQAENNVILTVRSMSQKVETTSLVPALQVLKKLVVTLRMIP